MRLLTVRERETLPIGGVAARLTQADADALFRLEPTLPRGVLNWEHRALRLGPFCGILRAGDLTVEILPKIAGESGDGVSSDGVLVAMLRSAGHLVESRIGAAPLASQRLHLLDVFVLDFCERVNELLRRGAIRAYEVREENLTAVRGRLNLPEHLRHNLLDRGHIHCRFDELSADNSHNRALKAVLIRLLGHPLGSEVKGAVNGLLRRMEDVSVRHCSVSDIARLRFDRLNRAWQPVFERAALFLKSLYPDVRAGELDGGCLLFDMERLFEAFVGARLRRHWSNSVGKRVVLQGPQWHLALGSAGPAFRMRPDITIVGNDGAIERIYDAKWKQLDTTTANRGISRDDMYQMVSYGGRYGCKCLALLFPGNEHETPGLIDVFELETQEIIRVEVYMLDLPALVRGATMPAELGPQPIP